MGIYLNPNNSEFERIVNTGEYVDKSGLIRYTNRVANSIKPFMASSRPRRFGKSLAVKMLTAYYSRGCESRTLFENLEISKDPSFEEHLNQYDVISLDIQEMRSGFLQDKKTACKNPLDYIQEKVLKEIKQAYPEYVSEGTTFIADALTQINQAVGNRFVIIIDEWDCFFREEKDNKALTDAYIIFLRSLFKGKQADQFIKLAYITGILPIKKYGTQSALNNFDELTMIMPADIAPYIGFTESEVQKLCLKTGMPFSVMQEWYDGYRFSRNKWEMGRKVSSLEHIYCPNSVMEAIRKQDFGCYWSKTETYESLKSYIEMNFDGLRDKVIGMLAGERCPIKVNTFQNDMTSMDSADDVLTLLVHLGYLAYDSERKEAFIPNLDVRESFESAMQTGKFAETARAIDESDRLIRATVSMKEELVAEQIEKVHRENINALAYNSEQALTTVILLAYYRARDEYEMFREMPLGEGFADIVFIPRRNCDKPALIVELKWNKDAETALDQIKARKYPGSLSEYHGNLLLVGINYDKEDKKHTCKIEKYEMALPEGT